MPARGRCDSWPVSATRSTPRFTSRSGAAAPDRYLGPQPGRMQLRHRYPDRYLGLHAQERAGPGTDVPADVRSKSWQRAVARLADLRAPAYRELSSQFRAQGMNRPAAYDRAMAILREADSDLFTRMLTEEYQLWLAVGTPPRGKGPLPCCPGNRP